MKKALFAAVILAAVSVQPAAAHHSFAMFDSSREVTLKGVVKQFQWTNPHSWLEVEVLSPTKVAETWSIEMLSPSVLGRMGWKRNSLKVGDEVTVVINPVRSGAHGGNMVNVMDAGGRKVGGLAP